MEVATTHNDLESLGLDDLALRIRSEHEAVRGAITEALKHALTAGEALLQARSLVPPGSWSQWLRDQDINLQSAGFYIRVASYQRELNESGVETLGQARRVLQGLPAIASPSSRSANDKLTMIVRRLHRDGESASAIAERCGITTNSVYRIIDPDGVRQKERAKRARHHQGERALRREQAAKRARAAGGHLAKGYALLRRTLEEVDASRDEVTSKKAKEASLQAGTNLRNAEEYYDKLIAALYQAEDMMGTALRG